MSAAEKKLHLITRPAATEGAVECAISHVAPAPRDSRRVCLLVRESSARAATPSQLLARRRRRVVNISASTGLASVTATESPSRPDFGSCFVCCFVFVPWPDCRARRRRRDARVWSGCRTEQGQTGQAAPTAAAAADDDGAERKQTP